MFLFKMSLSLLFVWSLLSHSAHDGGFLFSIQLSYYLVSSPCRCQQLRVGSQKTVFAQDVLRVFFFSPLIRFFFFFCILHTCALISQTYSVLFGCCLPWTPVSSGLHVSFFLTHVKQQTKSYLKTLWDLCEAIFMSVV